MTVRDTLIAWIDQFENDHYEFDVYGENVLVDLPRETVEKVLDISLLLCDRVVEAKDELFMADYLNMVPGPGRSKTDITTASLKQEEPSLLLNTL